MTTKTTQKLRRYFLSLAAILSVGAFAQAQSSDYTDFPGSVPRAAGQRSAATDLVLDGVTLTPDQADQLRKSKGVDLSGLDPAASDIWSRGAKSTSVSPLSVQASGESFGYLDTVLSVIGNFRFTVQKNDDQGVPHTYTIFFSKNVHNVLLRRALLMKMGYQVPDVKLLKKFTVKFSGSFSRNSFITEMGKNTFGDAGRWILNADDKEADTAILQDAVIISADNQIYDLSQGSITTETVQGRRVLNSVLVPYNLVDVPESVNLLTWHPGRIMNDMIYLPYDDADELNPSYDDARWSAKLIATLTRNDFVQIVAAGQYPAPVAALLLEKLVSRRNTLMSYFNVSAAKLNFDPNVTLAPGLVAGKITQTDFPGYGSRFAYGDPLAPLSASEIRAFAKSRVFGNLIDNAVSQFNANIVPHGDLSKAVYDHQVQMAQNNFLHFLQTGQSGNTPMGFWTTPMFAGNLIVSRDIVTGSYLGTDNLVQIADSFGFSVEGGLFVGTDGLPSALSLSAQAKLAFVRTYTHIKPIKSIKAAIKEPFKNIVVPLLKNDFAKTLDAVAMMKPGVAVTPEIQKTITDSMSAFSKQMGVGESILITDSLSGLAGVTASYGLAKNIDVYGNLSASKVIVRRLQIYRKDDNTIQIYRDPANYSIMAASVGFNAFIPIITLRLQRKAGVSQTFFYQLNIQPDADKNPDIVADVRALRSTLLENNTNAAEGLAKPFQINHKFEEKSGDLKILLWRWLGLETSDVIQAIAPTGEKKNFLYWSEAKMSGKSYEDLASDVIAKTLEEVSGSHSIVVQTPGSSLPGRGIFGSSVSRRTAFESELAPSPSKNPITESYVEISYEWKGWEISKDGILKIIKQISDKFAFNFYPPNVLSTTKKIQLYSLQLRMSIYGDGIKALAAAPPHKLRDILIRENKFSTENDCPSGSVCEMYGGNNVQSRSENMMRKFAMSQKRYFKAINAGDAKEASKQGMQMVSAVESVASTKGLIEMVGGKNNVYVQSTINGFRENDEAGDSSIISDTLGQIGSAKRSGPLRFVQQNLGMTDSEFFDYWILDKI
jgi:hypothetical protein